jgi:hypothetical protein
MRTLEEYVKQKRWDYGEGFVLAKTGRKLPAPFLMGKPLLPTSAFTDSGIDETKITTVKETHFRSAYTADRFSAPLILIKELDSLPIAYWDKGSLAYRHEIVGIHAPDSDAPELRKMFELLSERKKILCFIVTLHGSRSFVAKSTAILKWIDVPAVLFWGTPQSRLARGAE